MSGSVLFVVHGMGVFDSEWQSEVQTKLEEVAARYRAFAADPALLWQRVELVGIRYDDIFAAQIERWRAHAQGITGFIQEHQIDPGLDLSWVASFAKKDPDFFWTHVADVLLYYAFNLHRAAVQASVARQIVDKIQTLPNKAFDACTILAHSLGTAVTHDTTHLLGTEAFGGASQPFHPLDSRFRGICMLANTSRVLQRKVEAYKSIVRGGPRNNPRANCTQFFSWHHQWDPICLVKRYSPDAWETSGWPANNNTIGEVTHFRDWDVHGLTHYLDNPRIHIPLLNTVCGEEIVRPGERIEKIDKYERFGGRLRTIPEIEAGIRVIAAELTKLHENVDLATLFETWRVVHKLAKTLRAKIDALRAELAADIA